MLIRQNPLVYPGGEPGLNLAHPASSGLLQSVVASGNNVISLMNGVPGTAQNAANLTAKWLPIGPAVDIASTGNVHFGLTSATQTFLTIGAIFQLDSTPASFQWICGDATNVIALLVDNSHNFGYYYAGVHAVGPAAVAGHSYFFAGSAHSGVGFNWVLVDITLCQASSGNVSSANTFTTISAMDIGDFGAGGGEPLTGSVSAAMMSTASLSVAQLQGWGADPQSFWYPRRRFPFVGVVAGGATRGLFYNSPLTGLGAGGSFFPDRLAS